ncbi:MAG: LCP family protein [Chloroflexi bacterium]|nr:LCP family protein [Chloroflexota bacterium]
MRTDVFPAPAPAGAPERKAAAWLWQAIGAVVFVTFLSGGLLSGYYFYDTVRTWVAYTSLIPAPSVPDLPAIPPIAGTSGQNPAPSDPAASNPAAVQPPQVRLERKERINFLLMGVDLRPGETGATRSDTMIVVSLDPTSKSVAMLSIPRDLWVPIPGYGENRINTAYFTGDFRNYPGGGAALAKKTVQYNFGIPIHYYITINFVGFRKMVDTLGGVWIDVPKEIYDPAFPDDDYGFRLLHIVKGRQLMSGETALDYARTRHSDSDFSRMKRQQDVLKAIKDRALSLDILPKIPALWALKEDMVRTDLRLEDILNLAQIAKDVKAENIQSAVIDESMALGMVTPGGAQVLWPDREKIRKLVAELFTTPEPVAVPVQPPEQIRKLAAEGAKIEISNGTAADGLAGRVSEWLKSQGFTVVLVDNAERRDYPQTVIVESNSRPYALNLLAGIFHVPLDRVRKSPNPKSDLDIRIIVGQDFDDHEIPDSH